MPSGTAATGYPFGTAPGGLAGQQIAATILGCGALMLAGFAGNLGAAVWSATAVAVLAWLAIPVWVLALGRTLVRPRSVLPENRDCGRAGPPKGSMTMRTAYRVLAYLLALSVAVQASLIAFGAFALENNIDKGPVSDGDTTGVTLHHSFAYVVLLCAVALLGVSFGAKVRHGVRWAAIPLGLIVVQFFLAYAAYSAAIIGVLHGLNALAIFAVALLAGRRVPKTAPVAKPSVPEDAPV